MRVFSAALLTALVVPAAAWADPATLVAREVPLGGARALAAAAPTRFDLVGLHWRGSGTVRFRTRALDGRWSAWRAAAPEAEDQPDRGSAEGAATRAWRIGNPYWTGPSDRIEYRLAGRVTRLRAYFVRSPAGRAPIRTVSLAGSPAVVTRAAWQADEKIRRAAPKYAPALRFAVVHHTAGSNNYSPAQSAAIVRGIEVYHVKGNGWDDIGYNFLVDKYGQVFEGRYGGMDRPVIGAHALGFNRGSAGVAVIGDYGSASISAAARAALVKLLAWRLDIAHVDPLSTLSWTSTGNPRFPSGVPVFLRAISGHRDTGFTSCPGNALYAQIPGIAHAIAVTGLPKLYTPTVRGSVGGLVRFAAKLSAPLPWTVTVDDSAGDTVASGLGTGSTVDWTWDATSAHGGYTYAIAAGPTVRPATGSLGHGKSLPPELLSGIAVSPSIVTPNGDGLNETATLTYLLGLPALVTVTVQDADGAPLWTLFTGQKPAGPQTLVWSATEAPDGLYRFFVDAAAADGTETSGTVDIVVDRTLSAFAVAPTVFSPNGDGRFDSVLFTFGLAGPARVKLTVRRGSTVVGTVLSQDLQPGPQQVPWDGAVGTGHLADGSYDAVLSATDAVATLTQHVSLTSDTTPPHLRLVQPLRLRLSLDEPATVVLLVNGRRIVKSEPKGVFTVPHTGTVTTVSGVAMDAAGNESSPVRFP